MKCRRRLSELESISIDDGVGTRYKWKKKKRENNLPIERSSNFAYTIGFRRSFAWHDVIQERKSQAPTGSAQRDFCSSHGALFTLSLTRIDIDMPWRLRWRLTRPPLLRVNNFSKDRKANFPVIFFFFQFFFFFSVWQSCICTSRLYYHIIISSLTWYQCFMNQY